MQDEYAWSTWTAERPAEFTHLNTGLSITPVLYSDRAEAATVLPPGKQISYGQRDIRNGKIKFSTLFESTRLDWCCNREGETLDLSWRCRTNGEWGLRYWVCLGLSVPAGASLSYDKDTGLVAAEVDGVSFQACCKKKPLLVTVHEGVAELVEELESKGYFYLNSRGSYGSLLALRFNLDEAPEMSIRLNLHSSVVSKPTQLCENFSRQLDTADRSQNPLQAVHDVLAWNHVYDPVNNRPYTALTRNWSQKKFGGFGIWLNDNLFHAFMWAILDPDKSLQNIKAVFSGQTKAGNFPCLVTGNDAWLDRSQLPMASYVVWSLYRATNDDNILSWAYPKLLANHRWWWEKRLLDNTGLVAYGTSEGPGDGLYKGTKLAARNESAMDNMAVHDEADFDPVSGLLQSADVGLNSLLALDGEILMLMAQKLGFSDNEKEISERTGRHKIRIRSWLWDAKRAVFANRLLDGRFVDALAPTSFYPMVAGIASDDQVKSLIELYLEPKAKFGGKFSLPSAPRDHPAFDDNTYWRGRVWGPLNFWVYQGLVRCGRTPEAGRLAQKSLEMFNLHWCERKCGENYNAVTGEINDQPDTDSFYTWGALLPLLSCLQIVADNHWDGLTINLKPGLGVFGPIKSYLGEIMIASTKYAWEVSRDGRRWLSGSSPIALSNLEVLNSEFRAKISTEDKAAKLVFHDHAVVQSKLDGQNLAVEDNVVRLAAKLNKSLLLVKLGPKIKDK